MAKKKPNPGKGKPGRPAKGSPALPDPQLLEQLMRQFGGGPPRGDVPDTPLDKAQALVDEGFGEPDDRRRAQLAEEALRLAPDFADAYVLLAESAATRKQALDYYQRGVAAGERAIGPDGFRDLAGDFWGVLETRPYMRARLGLANILWTVGRRDEAVDHLRDMLRLNPGDNQGVRYTLAGFLLFLDRDADLAALLDQYPDEGTAAWAYTRALLAFRRSGDTPETRQLLTTAAKENKHVPAYLLGTKQPPAEPPGYYSIGDESEAVQYVGGFLAGWKTTPGAVEWVRATLAKPKARRPRGKGPTGPAKKSLAKNLPLEDDVWQADARPLPGWVQGDDRPVRPWAVLVTSLTNDLVLAHQIAEERPAAALIWDTLAQAMKSPAGGEPHRPGKIQVKAGEEWDALRPHLEELGIGLEPVPELDQLGTVFASMAGHVGGDSQPGLLDMPGITPDRVGRFFAAAAAFYRRAPWKRVGYESAVLVECDRFESGPWYGVLMGQSGLTAGLALYEDLSVLREMWSGTADDEENARRTVATSVTYGDEWEIAVGDLDAAARYGWEVARPDAYPQVFHKDPGMSMRPPLAWELDLVEACLRAIPDFVQRQSQDSPARETVVVPAGVGELKIVLSWVLEADS